MEGGRLWDKKEPLTPGKEAVDKSQPGSQMSDRNSGNYEKLMFEPGPQSFNRFLSTILTPPPSFFSLDITNFLEAGKSFSTKTKRDQANSHSHEALEPWFVFYVFSFKKKRLPDYPI